MTAYLWLNCDHVTDAYHHGGALLVVADSVAHARDLLRARGADSVPSFDRVPAQCAAFTSEPTILDLSSEQVFVFADMGCC